MYDMDEDLMMLEMALIEEECFPISQYTVYESKEPLQRRLWSSIQEFLQKMRNLIKSSIERVQKAVEKRVREKELKKSLKKIRAEISSQKGKTVEFYDVWKYQDVMDRAIKDLDAQIHRFLVKYNHLGSGLTQTTIFVDRIQKTITKYDVQLKKLQTEKITVPVEKVISWIDQQILSGRIKLFDFGTTYLKKLEEYEKIAAEFDEKATRYAEKTGMVKKPTGLTDVIKNTTIFVKRNIDWIGPAVVAVSLHFAAALFKTVAANNEYDELTNRYPSRGNAESTNRFSDEQLENIALANVKDGSVLAKGNKKYVAAKRLSNLGTVASIGISGENMKKAMDSKRNSV